MSTIEQFPVVEGSRLGWTKNLILWFVKLRAEIEAIQLQSPFIFSNAGRVLVTDSTGSPETSSITSSELDALNGISGNIQTQLNTKMVKYTVVTKTADYTAAGGELVLADCTSGNVQITLPAAAAESLPIAVKRIDGSANSVTIVRTGADTLDAQTVITFTLQYATLTFYPATDKWLVA